MLALAAFVAWLWWTGRDVLVALVPFVLVVPPVLAFGAQYLGWPALLPSSKLLLLALLGIWAVAAALRRRPLGVTSALLVGFCYAGLVTISVVWSLFGPAASQPDALLTEFVEWLAPVLVFAALAATPRGEDDVRLALRGLTTCVMCVAAFSVLQALAIAGQTAFVPTPIVDLTSAGREVLWFGSLRVYGPFANIGPNALGVFLIFPLVLFLRRALSSSGRHRAAWSVAMALCATVIVLSYSRGAQLGAIAAVVIVLALSGRFGTITLVGVALACLLVVFAESTVVSGILSGFGIGGALDTDVEGRFLIWKMIVREFPTHPVGWGFNGWLRASAYLMQTSDPLFAVGAVQPADNMWMRELADRGIPGVLALAALIGSLALAARRAAKRAVSGSATADWLNAACAATVGWAAAFMSGDHLMYVNVSGMFWYFNGIAVGAALAVVGVPATEPRVVAVTA